MINLLFLIVFIKISDAGSTSERVVLFPTLNRLQKLVTSENEVISKVLERMEIAASSEDLEKIQLLEDLELRKIMRKIEAERDFKIDDSQSTSHLQFPVNKDRFQKYPLSFQQSIRSRITGSNIGHDSELPINWGV